jgi:hypothetical protein
MGAQTYLRASVIATAILFGSFDTSGTAPSLGVSPAAARDFYTRKRVHGKWTTGHFYYKKRHAVTKAKTRKARVSKAKKNRLARAKLTHTKVLTQPHRTSRRQRSGIAWKPWWPPQSWYLFRPAPNGQVYTAPGWTTQWEAPPDFREEEYLRRMREGLRLRASAMGGAPHQAGVVAVTLDFPRGIKMTRFSDGSISEEPFDAETYRSLLRAVPGAR